MSRKPGLFSAVEPHDYSSCMQDLKLRHMHSQQAAWSDFECALGLRRAVIFPVLLRPQMRQRLADGWDALLLVTLRDLWVCSLPQSSEIYTTCAVWRNRLSCVVG